MGAVTGRWARILKHRWMDESDTARALDAAALKRLERAWRPAKGAQRRDPPLRGSRPAAVLPVARATARQRAVTMFGKLRVWDTEHNNGVLIYLLLAEHAIEIVADRGLARHVPQAHWDALVEGMRKAFRGGQFEAGLMQAIDAVDKLLLQHFALAPGQHNPNELPGSA
jgi:hypothetical protein